jgi:putative tricarboxylic transport membrane protein
MMKRLESEVIGSLFWMAVGICFALDGVKLKLGTLRNPDTGFLPMIMALILVLFSSFTLIKGLSKMTNPISRIPWRHQTLVITSVIFYGYLLDFIGFLLSTFILMFILFGLLIKGNRKWFIVFLYSATTALSTWLIFSVVLKVPFPLPRLITLWR